MGSFQRVALLAAALGVAAPVFACDVPDEGGDTPWRRAVAKVRYLPDVEAMADANSRERNVVQYVVSLDEARRFEGGCWWPVEVRLNGKPWKRYLVTTDGRRMREDGVPARN